MFSGSALHSPEGVLGREQSSPSTTPHSSSPSPSSLHHQYNHHHQHQHQHQLYQQLQSANTLHQQHQQHQQLMNSQYHEPMREFSKVEDNSDQYQQVMRNHHHQQYRGGEGGRGVAIEAASALVSSTFSHHQYSDHMSPSPTSPTPVTSSTNAQHHHQQHHQGISDAYDVIREDDINEGVKSGDINACDAGGGCLGDGDLFERRMAASDDGSGEGARMSGEVSSDDRDGGSSRGEDVEVYHPSNYNIGDDSVLFPKAEVWRGTSIAQLRRRAYEHTATLAMYR